MELIDFKLLGIVIIWCILSIISLGVIVYFLFDRPNNRNKDKHIVIVKNKKRKGKKKKNKKYYRT